MQTINQILQLFSHCAHIRTLKFTVNNDDVDKVLMYVHICLIKT